MKPKRNKLIIAILLCFLASSSVVFMKYDFLKSLWHFVFFNRYNYVFICNKDASHCITAIQYYEDIGVGHSHERYFVVYGKKRLKVPINDKYIELAKNSGLAVKWEGINKCNIITNLPPVLVQSISNEVEIDMVYSNHKYESSSSQDKVF